MQNKIHRVLSLLLVVIMVLSMIPAALAAENSASAVYAAENTTTGAQYADVNEAIAAAQAGQIVKVLADAENVAYGNAGVILDLNGCNLTNVTVAEGVTLTAIDSATDDYEGAYGSLTTEGDVAATVKTAEPKSYVAISDNGSYSFHRYYASIAAISLQPSKVSLGYRAEFRGDEAVKNAVISYGYELWANDNSHKTYARTDKLEKSSLTLRLSNILREDNDALNAVGSTATIGGNAFISLDLGNQQVTLYGTEQETSLRQVVEAVNASAGSFGEAQLSAAREMITTYSAWMMGWATENIFAGGEGTEGDGLKVEIVVDVNAENNILSQDATMSYGDITATIPQGAVLENGVKQLVLTITEKAESDSDVTEGEGETLIPLDVHISGISADNTAPIVICLGDILPKGLNIGNYDLFHVENGKTVPMSRVYTISELDAHNEFYYDPATGSVTVAMASFSEVALLAANDGTWDGGVDHTWYNADATTLYIYNADQLWSFSQIVGGMMGKTQDSFAGKTVVLYADIDLDDNEEVSTETDGKIFYPIGYYNSDGTYEKTGTAISSAFKAFAGTFDGNGHTIANFYQNTWEMKGDHNWYAPEDQYYRDGMGLFGKVYGGTIKNLTVKNFSSDGEITTTGTIAAYADNGATFENISIFNCNPRVYNIGNGGIVGCVGWYNNEATDENPVTFRNITVDNTNKISALWGSYDVACGGLVGQYYPTSGQTNATANAGIHMDNCHVSAQIDVYNDVCGNYMYYAYRYAGMLIGSVRENVTGEDGRVYPKMDGITANACTVHYGEWNHYYYCEFVSNGHPSYAQEDEYKFSRVPESELVRNDEGKVIGCTHNHSEVEDNQAVYLPFYDQLVTGYGWGVTSKGIADIPGVTVLDRVVADSVEKFETIDDVQTAYTSGAVMTVGDLFKAADSGVDIDADAVQVFVSPADKESTVYGTYAANTSDWTKGILVLTGSGAATITITDYNYCTETTLNVTVSAPAANSGEYQKVTENPTDWSGKYLIVYEAGKVAFNGSLTTLDAVSNTISVTINDNTIAANDTVNAAAFTIDNNGYIKSSSGYYIGQTSNANGLKSSTSTTYKNTISMNNDDTINIISGGAYLRFNAAADQNRFRYYKSDSYTNQKAIALYKLVEGESNGCSHIGAEIEITPVSCTEDGKVVITCKCGTLESAITKLGHQWGEWVETLAPTCTEKGSRTATCERCEEKKYEQPAALGHTWNEGEITTAATCTETGVKTYTCGTCGETKTEEIAMIDHNYVNGTCAGCGKEDPNAGGEVQEGWYLVTDVSSLKAGDQIVIVAKGSNVALSTEQKTNNRGQASVTKGEGTVEINDKVQVLTLEAGTTDGTFAFYTGSGYLYAASSDSNLLKTQTTNNANSSWKITITSAGVATIKAQGTNTRNWLRYNSSSSLFACYTSGQQDVCIYKLESGGNEGGNSGGTPTWKKATSIAVGDTVVFVYETGKKELTSTASGYGSGTSYTTQIAGTWNFEVVAGSSSGTFAFKTTDGKYLSWLSGNSLTTSDTLNANSSWVVTFDSNGNAVITNAKDNTRKLQWNASAPRFACYTSNQAAIQLYKES